jgi:hypothetical protein
MYEHMGTHMDVDTAAKKKMEDEEEQVAELIS